MQLKNSVWKKVDAKLVLQAVALYPPEELAVEDTFDSHSPQAKARETVEKWLRDLGGGQWATNAASTLASAFVLGHLMPYSDSDVNMQVNTAEREMGMAICTLASLVHEGHLCNSASNALWPAIFKGLQLQTTVGMTSFSKANRSMVLLEFGCQENVISGFGHGDLVLDSTQEYMMPPPPQIESVLDNAAQFVMMQLTALAAPLGATHEEGKGSGSTRSGTSTVATNQLSILISQLRVLHLAYPSSDTLSQAVNKMLKHCVASLSTAGATDNLDTMEWLVLLFGSLSCGATFGGSSKLQTMVTACNNLLITKLSFPKGIKKDSKQACRSIFQYAKWGSISLILSCIRERSGSSSPELLSLIKDTYQAIAH